MYIPTPSSDTCGETVLGSGSRCNCAKTYTVDKELYLKF